MYVTALIEYRTLIQPTVVWQSRRKPKVLKERRIQYNDPVGDNQKWKGPISVGGIVQPLLKLNPGYAKGFLSLVNSHTLPDVARTNTAYCQLAFRILARQNWNGLPSNIQLACSLTVFYEASRNIFNFGCLQLIYRVTLGACLCNSWLV